MTRSLSRWQEALAGLLVVVALVGASYGLFAIGDRQRMWSGTFNVHVGFDKLQGVGVGTPVRVRGLEAGAVAAIDLPASGKPDAPLVLKLQLDRRYSSMLFADSTARIVSEGMVGGKVIELEPGLPQHGQLVEGSVIASKPGNDFNDVIEQAKAVVDDIKNGKGSLGKALRDDSVYKEMAGTLEQTKQLMQKSQEAANAIQQDADAIKRLPIIRGYVEDTTELMVRHTGERHRKVFAADELFEPSRAALIPDGKAKLDELGPWLTGLRANNSDVVIVAYADAKAGWTNQVAQTLTVKQAEAVTNYLKDQHSAHKLGWWSRRKVTPIGMGTKPPPVAESESVPAARIEVLVFVP